jgi:hypothetical protein
VKDYIRSYDFQVEPSAGGMLVKETDRWIAPNYFRQDMVLPTGKVSAYTDGRIGWIATPQGSGPLAGAQLKQVQGDLFRLYFRLLLSDRIAGRKVNALDDNTVEISDTGGAIARLELNAETGLPQRLLYEVARASGPPIPEEEVWADFQEVAGVKVPQKTTIMQGGRKFAEMKLTECKVNSGIQLQELQKQP